MLLNGECKIHGSQDGVPDLRIKCIVDDGYGSVNAVIDRKNSEKLLKKKLEEYKEMTPECLHNDIVHTLFARPMGLRGNAINDSFGTTFIVQEVHMMDEDIKQKAATLADELEELE